MRRRDVLDEPATPDIESAHGRTDRPRRVASLVRRLRGRRRVWFGTELEPEELARRDPCFGLAVAVRAVRAARDA